MMVDFEVLAQRQAEGQGKGFGPNGGDGAVTQGVKMWDGKARDAGSFAMHCTK